MTTIEIVLPPATTQEMQAIWNACPNSTLTLLDGKHELLTQAIWIARIPRRIGEHVQAKPVRFDIQTKLHVTRWRAELFGKYTLSGRLIPQRFLGIRAEAGDEIIFTLDVVGG